MRPIQQLALFVTYLAVLAGCAQGRSAAPPNWVVSAPAPVTVRELAVVGQAPCEGHFVEHQLLFATGVRIREINTYESNGAGLAINDLDKDGDLDLVFASIDREAAILWNEGALHFRSEPLPAQFTRAVAIVDVDGDGWLDIVFTHRGLASPSFWRNTGAEGAVQFSQTPLTGVESYAYSMAWADLNGDNQLDLVTGSYNVELKQANQPPPEQDPHAGVFYYEQQAGIFHPQLLSPQAQALTIGLVDLNHDHQLDIWVANDFVQQDQFWLRTGTDQAAAASPTDWQAVRPFEQTSHSTMSIDWGDLDNSGATDYLTTDMNPDDIGIETTAAWLPVIAKLEQPHGSNDPQIMANVLQVTGNDNQTSNQAARRGIDATGWSWAGKFGDLDNDGLLDLYIVNGMIAANLFTHLPNDELVEENKAFRNAGDGAFQLAPEWGLGSKASGRGMMMPDLDGDGDLDIVVSNLRAPAQLFENRLCGGDSLQVELRWPGSKNPYAIGAQVRLHTANGVYSRDVRATSGYLSGDPTRIHFGLPAGATPQILEIRWPDGAISQVDSPTAQTILEVTRTPDN